MYRIPVYKVSLVRERSHTVECHIVTSPATAYQILNEFIGDADREQFVILLLDTRNIVRGLHVASIGTLSAALVHPREVFKPAMLANAAAIILGHNHPSGDPTPSTEDLALTARLMQSGELLGIPVLDHLVLGHEIFISMKERHLMEEHSCADNA